jgi:hypothetical protein
MIVHIIVFFIYFVSRGGDFFMWLSVINEIDKEAGEEKPPS